MYQNDNVQKPRCDNSQSKSLLINDNIDNIYGIYEYLLMIMWINAKSECTQR